MRRAPRYGNSRPALATGKTARPLYHPRRRLHSPPHGPVFWHARESLCRSGRKDNGCGIAKQRNLMTGVSREQAIGYAKEVFTPCLDHAAARGVTLALEPLSSVETN